MMLQLGCIVSLMPGVEQHLLWIVHCPPTMHMTSCFLLAAVLPSSLCVAAKTT